MYLHTSMYQACTFIPQCTKHVPSYLNVPSMYLHTSMYQACTFIPQCTKYVCTFIPQCTKQVPSYLNVPSMYVPSYLNVPSCTFIYYTGRLLICKSKPINIRMYVHAQVLTPVIRTWLCSEPLTSCQQRRSNCQPRTQAVVHEKQTAPQLHCC